MSQYTFDHVHLMSPDPMKTAEFYKNNFGATVTVRDLGEGRIMVNVHLGGVNIKISKATGDAQAGLVHFGIRAGDLAGEVKKLKANGVPFTRELREALPGVKIAFMTAPEDVSIELMEGTV